MTTMKAMVYYGENDIRFEDRPIPQIIEHTDVDDSLRGQGVGNKLLERVVAFAREKNVKIIPLCPFAKSVFDKDSSIHDVLK